MRKITSILLAFVLALTLVPTAWAAETLETEAENKDTYLIQSKEDLQLFATTVNANNYAYAGKTIKLTTDIDLEGADWEPIMMAGTNADYGNQRITFDGNGKTISNFTVNAKEGEHNTGFFGEANYSDIKNLTINNATVSGINRIGAIVGRGMCTTVEGCTVTNSTITAAVWWDPAEKNNTGYWNDGDKAGAIAGWLDEGVHGATNCTVDNCKITGYRDIAGLIGYVGDGSGSTATVSGNTVKNTTVTQVTTNGYESTIPVTVEEIVGRYYTGLDLAKNTATNVTTVTSDNAKTTTTVTEIAVPTDAAVNTIDVSSNVTLDSSNKTAEVTVSQNELSKVVNANATTPVEFKVAADTSVTFNKEAVQSIAENSAFTGNITLIVTPDATVSGREETAKNSVTKDTNAKVVELKLVGSENANLFEAAAGAKATVTVPFTMPAGNNTVKVYYLNAENEQAEYVGTATVGSGTATFTVSHFSNYVLVPTTVTTYHYYNAGTSTTTGNTTSSPKTFDAGVGIYAVSAVLSVTGMAYVGKKKF